MDRFTQVTERSRRHALRLTLGGLAAAAAGLATSGPGADARNRNRKKGKKQQGGAQCQCVPVGEGFSSPCFSYADCCTTTTNLICATPNTGPDPVQQCLGGVNYPCPGFPGVCAPGFSCNGVSCQPDAP